MFNRQKYNRGRFNRPLTDAVAVPLSGTITIGMQTAGGRLNAALNLRGNTDVRFRVASPTFYAGSIKIEPEVSGHINRTVTLSGVISLATEASGQVNRTVFVGGIVSTETAVTGTMQRVASYSGTSSIGINANGRVNRATTVKGTATLMPDINGQVNRSTPLSGIVDISHALNGKLGRERNLEGNVSINVAAIMPYGFSTFRYETLSLTTPGFIFRPGDEMVIDTDNMTVEINGQNAMRWLDRESEFFLFNPGINEITVDTQAPNSRFDMRALWKDAWL